MEIAVAVSGIKRLHWYRDQELALTCVANAFPFRRMADPLSLMQWVRHVVSESALFEDPLAIGSSKEWEGHEKEGDQ
jgi:hypothetical protein